MVFLTCPLVTFFLYVLPYLIKWYYVCRLRHIAREGSFNWELKNAAPRTGAALAYEAIKQQFSKCH